MSIETDQEPFCLAPWVHSHINEDGKRYLCCKADKAHSFSKDIKEPFDDYWNSIEMREVRKKMLNQTPPKECMGCVQGDSAQKPYREHFNRLYGSMWEHLQEQSDQDGLYKKKPVDFDYRINDICNLSCRMCSSEFSSSIYALEAKSGLKESRSQDSREVKKNMEVEFESLVGNTETRRIYFADGEPLLSKLNWKMLDNLIVSGISRNVELAFNTNLTQIHLYKAKINTVIARFKKVEFIVSIDGVGETQEFVRNGVDWNQWVTNLSELKNMVSSHRIFFNITFTTPLLMNLRPLIEFLKDQKIEFRVGNVVFNRSPEVVLCPSALPKKVRTNLVHKALKEVPEDSSFGAFKSILNSYLLEGPLDLPTEENKIFLAEALQYHSTIDVHRANKKTLFLYYLQFPELKEVVLNDWLLGVLSTTQKMCSYFEVNADDLLDNASREIFYFKFLFRDKNARAKIDNYIHHDLARQSGKIVVVEESRFSLLNVLLLNDPKNSLFFSFKRRKIFPKDRYILMKTVSLPLYPEAVFKNEVLIKLFFPVLSRLSRVFPWLFGMHARSIFFHV